MSVQFLKEKTGTTQTEIDPEFEDAIGKLKIIQERFEKFKSYINTMLSVIPDIFEIANDMTNSFDNADKLSGSHSSKIVESHQAFFSKLSDLLDEDIVDPCQEKIMKSIQEIVDRTSKLSELKDSRRQAQLLCDSYRDKVIRKSKSSSAEKVAKSKLKYERHQKAVKEQTETFTREVNEMWVHRFELMEKPMEQFVEIIFKFSQKIFENMQTFQSGFTLEELQNEFDPAEK
ncbi:hypothetical protein GPJ56_010183 [Histomonas meleagridis]|uniref:uncharacterized protein n=1 Tax=Histomonas meleagridis TaxID=135588 RepID=UPI00355A0432|nr:hypothetical protein GPJ56_010183 [Histomonas meleagridis]KAH0804719.1 hypothetical protein GO595_002413 [Histomonas meleagridis]